jgi:hypothetical protein
VHKIIGTNQLTINELPDASANWSEISLFALSFDPKVELGKTDIYNVQFAEFDEGSSIQQLRTTLFLLQRAWNHRGQIDANGLEELRRVISLIRKKVNHPDI